LYKPRIVGGITLKQKVKLKAKGKKYYQNTHGKIYRVKAKPKLRKASELKKQNRKLALTGT
jgi:hypothetical protein